MRMNNKQKNEKIVKAINKNVKSSPRKVNLILKSITGMGVNEAVKNLTFARKRIAHDIKKTVQSAVANAENNHQLDVDRLFIKEATVGKTLVLKRFRARARGRVGRIRKPVSNLTIIVQEREETE